jgi:hypothetical protein
MPYSDHVPAFPRLGSARSAALVLTSHSARKERGACASFRGLGRRARYFESLLTGRETPYARDRERVVRSAGSRSAASMRGVYAQTTPGPARRCRAGTHRRETDRRHSPWAHAGTGTNYTPSLHDIVRMPDCLGPARLRRSREWQDTARSRRGRPWSQLLSVAPVFFDTSATIFDTVASISASVIVRSRGCSVM